MLKAGERWPTEFFAVDRRSAQQHAMEESVEVAQYDEGWGGRRAHVVLLDQLVALELPDAVRVVVHHLEGVAGRHTGGGDGDGRGVNVCVCVCVWCVRVRVCVRVCAYVCVWLVKAASPKPSLTKSAANQHSYTKLTRCPLPSCNKERLQII